MEDHSNPAAGILTVISACFAAVSASLTFLAKIQSFVSIGAGIVAMLSGTMALIYYYNQNKKVVHEIKKATKAR